MQRLTAIVFCLLFVPTLGWAQRSAEPVTFGPYEYEAKPDGESFAPFNPRRAPEPGELLLREGDRLAICGDSITEQKMYSRMIETYLTVCAPELKVTVRQYGWSGEKTDGFLRRMELDCLTFKPTVATLAYGMNDSRYRPFDITNGLWYEDHYTAIVRRFQQDGVRVVVGSPGCAGKLATWVNSRVGTLEEHNLHLCALRDIALGVAVKEDVRFADIFWPMYKAQILAPEMHGSTADQPYEVAGRDGIHPGWAGQVIMAYAFLRSLGLSGEIGSIEMDMSTGKVQVSEGHRLVESSPGEAIFSSSRYPFCAEGSLDRDDSIRSGMTLVPFAEELNRLTLKVSGVDDAQFRVVWGEYEKEFSGAALRSGINLAWEFPVNPFSESFHKVDDAVAAKQAYETEQIKRQFHGPRRRTEFKQLVEETELVREPLARAIGEAYHAVEHRIRIERLEN